eukprot:6198504-Pleurochrysis_carterae.AAC.1
MHAHTLARPRARTRARARAHAPPCSRAPVLPCPKCAHAHGLRARARLQRHTIPSPTKETTLLSPPPPFSMFCGTSSSSRASRTTTRRLNMLRSTNTANRRARSEAVETSCFRFHARSSPLATFSEALSVTSWKFSTHKAVVVKDVFRVYLHLHAGRRGSNIVIFESCAAVPRARAFSVCFVLHLPFGT